MSAMASKISSLMICLLSRLFRHRSKKTSKPRVTGLCVGNSPMDNANSQDSNPAVLKQELLPSGNSSWLKAIPRLYRAIRTGLWSSLVSPWEGIFVRCFQWIFICPSYTRGCLYFSRRYKTSSTTHDWWHVVVTIYMSANQYTKYGVCIHGFQQHFYQHHPYLWPIA